MKTSTTSLKNASLLGVLVLIASNTLSFGSAQAISLVNPSFEADSVTTLPVINGDSQYESSAVTRTGSNFVVTAENNITGWRTTAADGGIELWQSGFSGGALVPVTVANAGNGNQFAEINAITAATLYQEIVAPATGGQTQLYFDFWHRARENQGNTNLAINIIQLTITDMTGAATDANGAITSGGTTLFQRDFVTKLLDTANPGANNGWFNYQSSAFSAFFVDTSASAKTVRFSYSALASTDGLNTTTSDGSTGAQNATNTITYGNFIDNAQFSTAPIPFDFSPNLGIGILGALYLGNKAIHSLRNKKDINS
jgi:hypothetical protein